MLQEKGQVNLFLQFGKTSGRKTMRGAWLTFFYSADVSIQTAEELF
jgi:hypothetical protein